MPLCKTPSCEAFLLCQSNLQLNARLSFLLCKKRTHTLQLALLPELQIQRSNCIRRVHKAKFRERLSVVNLIFSGLSRGLHLHLSTWLMVRQTGLSAEINCRWGVQTNTSLKWSRKLWRLALHKTLVFPLIPNVLIHLICISPPFYFQE